VEGDPGASFDVKPGTQRYLVMGKAPPDTLDGMRLCNRKTHALATMPGSMRSFAAQNAFLQEGRDDVRSVGVC